jgi:phosphoserine aminotransferase
VIVRDDLVKRSPSSLATMLQYSVHAENKSMFNTPAGVAIYVMRLVMAWLVKSGGLEAAEKVNIRKRTNCMRPSTAPASTAAMPLPTAGRG